jgi:hypothetical protein
VLYVCVKVNRKIQAGCVKFLERKLACECRLEGRPRPTLRYYISFCEEGLKKTTESLSHFVQFPDYNLSPGTFAYECGAVTVSHGIGYYFGKPVSALGNLLTPSVVYLKIEEAGSYRTLKMEAACFSIVTC